MITQNVNTNSIFTIWDLQLLNRIHFRIHSTLVLNKKKKTEYILKKNICILFYYCIIFHHNQSHCIKWASELYFIFDKTFCINRSQELQDNCKISLAKKNRKNCIKSSLSMIEKGFFDSPLCIESFKLHLVHWRLDKLADRIFSCASFSNSIENIFGIWRPK